MKDEFDIKKFGAWLKEHNLKGEIKDTVIQGGASSIPENLKDQIRYINNKNAFLIKL